MKILTSLNRKGGVGKTHCCWLIASVCIERGRRCLIVDLDEQANITQSFLPGHDEPVGVEAVFDRDSTWSPADVIHSTRFPEIDIIPATGQFGRYDTSAGTRWRETGQHRLLSDALHEIAGGYDYVLLDCPPRISLASFSALCASDFCITPVEAADWGARGTAAVRAAIELVQQSDNPDLQLLGHVVSKFKQRRSFQKAYLQEIRRMLGDDVFQSVVPDLAAFERSVDTRTPITISSPSSDAADIARQFFDELEQRIAAKTSGRRQRRQTGARAVAADCAH